MNAWSFQRVGTLLAVVVMASTANAHPPKIHKPDLVCHVSVTLPSGQIVTNGGILEILPNRPVELTVHYSLRNRGEAKAGTSAGMHQWHFAPPGPTNQPESVGERWQDNNPELLPRDVVNHPNTKVTIRSRGNFSASVAVDTGSKVDEEDETNNFCGFDFVVAYPKLQTIPVQPKEKAAP
jgi:hypothetical protein